MAEIPISDAAHSEKVTQAKALASRVLENIAQLSESNLFFGQEVLSRASRRRDFPRKDFYALDPMPGGLPDHHHSYLEMATVLEGRLHVVIGSMVYSARKGDWFVFPPDVSHGEFNLAGKTGYRLLWLIFPQDRLFFQQTRYSAANGYGIEQFGSIQGISLDSAAGLTVAFISNGADAADAIRVRLLRLVASWLEILNDTPDRLISNQHPVISRVQSALSESQGKPPTVAELAKQVGLSPNYLSDLFHRCTGKTLRGAIQERRIEQSRHCLADFSLSIKEVADRLGFADSQHFNHAFRRLAGTTPSAYRKRLFRETDKKS